MSMRHLMQYLNGAALASIWVFFEHIDKLNYINLQTFNKEIQMVQQQFIIAELSQDSSVITAHITVGNHSHSQAQKSIEQRFNPQRAALNLDDEERQQDIKIEDNFHRNEDNDDQDEEPSDDEELLPQRDQFDENNNIMDSPELNLEDERPLDSESGENIFDSQNLGAFKGNMHKERLQHMLNEEKNYTSNRPRSKHTSPKEYDISDRDAHEEYKEEEKHQRQESSHMKVHDKTGSHDTTNDEGAKMNKICFGVFASISHEFILENPQKADEISLSLQSAFRVISLNRPEYKIILKALLKCEGIKNYEELAENIYEFVNRIKAAAPNGATDQNFSFTYYDVQAIVKSIGHLTEQNWKDRAVYYNKLREEKLEEAEDPLCDYRDKSKMEERKAEIEAMLDAKERKERITVECNATMKTLELYAIQR